MRVVAAVATVAVVAGLAGCRAGEGPATGPPSSFAPGASVDEAIARTEAVATGRFVVSIVATGSDRPVSLRARGEFDRDLGAFTVTTDLSVFVPDLDGSVTIVATPDGLFVDCPSLARLLQVSTRWIGVRGGAADTLRSSVVDPLEVLEKVRRSAAAGTVEVVVGDDGRVRRAGVRFDAAAAGSAAWLSVEFVDLGLPVDIRSPAPGQATDETEALNRLLGGSTGG